MMDQSLAELFAQCDEHDAMSEALEAKHAALKTRDGNNAGLIFKRYENPPLQSHAATMDDATQRKWDAWCDFRVKRMIKGPLKQAIAEVIARERKSMREHVAKELAALRSAIIGNKNDTR